MTQDERRIWLTRQLQKEMPQYADVEIPKDPQRQWMLLRGLFNVRMPGPASDEFRKIEGEFLQEMTREKGITDVNDLKPCILDSRLYLWQGDITTLRCDAIVNAANSGMTGCYVPNHGCIDNAEQTYAGVELRYACYSYMLQKSEVYGTGYEEPAGRAVITKGYNLPAKYVIHTVGPIVQGWLTQKDMNLLASCYTSCLDAADQNNCKSIAFCCISTGVFSFPQDKACEIAVNTVRDWLDQHPGSSIKKVVFNVYKDEDLRLYNVRLNKRIRIK